METKCARSSVSAAFPPWFWLLVPPSGYPQSRDGGALQGLLAPSLSRTRFTTTCAFFICTLFFLRSRQLCGCHQQFIHITGRGYKRMCVIWFKMTFRPDDRCAADCWVAARLRSSSPTSPALFLSSRGMERCPRAESDIRGDLREMKRTCHSLSRRRRQRHGGYTHSVLFLWSPPQRPGPETLAMKNDPFYTFDPICFINLTPLQHFDLLTFHQLTRAPSLPHVPLD